MNRPWLPIAVILSVASSITLNTGTANSSTIGSSIGSSLASQTTPPSGGIDAFGPDSLKAFQVAPNDLVKTELIDVPGQDFKRAWRVTGVKPVNQPYDSQLTANNIVAIKKNDVMLVQFWARSIGGKPARTEFLLELGVEPYDKSVNIAVRLTPRWTLYSSSFKAGRDFANGTASAHFRLGYNNQAFELGGVVLKNYATTQTLEKLPFAGFTYAGHETNAAWRKTADARIEQIRKTDFKLKVIDATGKAIPNASVKLEMQRHAFRFGSAVLATKIIEDSSDAAKYRKTILELFNHVVLDSDLKWPDWEEYGRKPALAALKFFANNNISVRGHNLIWPCDNDYCLPSDVPAMFSNPAQLRSRIDSHLQDILGATRGQLTEWDVINEPSANKRLSNVLGEDEMAAQFKRVKQLEPTAKLFLNDADNLGEGTSDIKYDVEYKRIIARMLALNAPLEGIGLQGHFGYQLTPPAELLTRLEDFGKFGLPLAITEFDVNLFNEQLQADYLRDFLTIAFSSPSVDSFLMWGFWEGNDWIPNAALYRQDWSLKPNGQAFKELLFKRWWTNANGRSNATGEFATRGFLGDYKLTVKLGSKTVTQNLKLEKTTGEILIKLP